MSLLLIGLIFILLALAAVVYLYISKTKRVNELKVKTTFGAKADELVRVEMSGNDAEFEIAQNFNIIGEKFSKYKNSNAELSRKMAEMQDVHSKIKVFENSMLNLNLLTDIGKQITSCLTINEIAVKLFNNINSSMVAEEVNMLIIIDGKKKYFNVIDGHISEIEDTSWCDDRDNFLNWAFENNREVFLNHTSADYAQYVYKPQKLQNGAIAESAIAIPLSISRKMIGAVSVLSSSVNSFSNFHLEFTRSLASYVSVAMENAILYGELDLEKQKSEHLLLNILPPEIVIELKEKGKTKAKDFDNVTVMFTDFVNFTSAGERMTPQELVDELDTCFKAFDDITGKYNIEKIKTIGDAYLAVAGMPTADPMHAENIVNAALEINRFMQSRLVLTNVKSFDIRIGIHTGRLVAGIVGVKKFAYDIWGDTVNTAARMEQNGEPGKINISGATYELIKDKFRCEYRGKIPAKGKGEIDMYFVLGKGGH